MAAESLKTMVNIVVLTCQVNPSPQDGNQIPLHKMEIKGIKAVKHGEQKQSTMFPHSTTISFHRLSQRQHQQINYEPTIKQDNNQVMITIF
ncbi:hypothetical protein ACHQM5_017596 [Ranunculus cassubicifolius]